MVVDRREPLDYERARPPRPFPTGSAVVLFIFIAGAFFLAGLFGAAKLLRSMGPNQPPPAPTPVSPTSAPSGMRQ